MQIFKGSRHKGGSGEENAMRSQSGLHTFRKICGSEIISKREFGVRVHSHEEGHGSIRVLSDVHLAFKRVLESGRDRSTHEDGHRVFVESVEE